MMINEYGALVE